MNTTIALASLAASLLMAGSFIARSGFASSASLSLPVAVEPITEEDAIFSGGNPPEPADSIEIVLEDGFPPVVEPQIELEPTAEIPESREATLMEDDPFEAPEPMVMPPDREAPDASAVQVASDTVSVDFPDEEIRVIMRVVADMFDLNLVIPDTLTGRASIKLRHVTWRQVFDVVLSPVGFTFIEEAGIIRVLSLEDLTREPMTTEVMILNYSRAEEISPTIMAMIDTGLGGRLQVDRRSNALVITERPTQMRRIRGIIESLDQPTAQVMIESKFIETTTNNLRNIGVNWSSLEGYKVGAGPFARSYEKDSRQTRASGSDWSSSTSNQSFTEQRQGFSGGTPINDSIASSQASAAAAAGSFGDVASAHQTARLTTAVFSAAEFDVIISALKTVEDAKLVSNPMVVTLNNTPAMISIGERFPIPQYVFNAERGAFEVSGFDFEDIGINLNVTPQVNPRGFINLDIKPEVSTLGSVTTFGGAGGAQIPIIDSRRTESQIMIRDGYTLALGGLARDETRNNESKVPLLGDIPAVGRFFRSESKSTEQRNLIIFITARTLNPDGSTFEEVIDPRMTRAMNLRREDIPGYRPDLDHFPPVEVMTEPEPVEEIRRGGSRRMRQPGGRAGVDSGPVDPDVVSTGTDVPVFELYRPWELESVPVIDTSVPPDAPLINSYSPTASEAPGVSHSEAALALRQREDVFPIGQP